jgi:hypothetical protein
VAENVGVGNSTVKVGVGVVVDVTVLVKVGKAVIVGEGVVVSVAVDDASTISAGAFLVDNTGDGVIEDDIFKHPASDKINIQ